MEIKTLKKKMTGNRISVITNCRFAPNKELSETNRNVVIKKLRFTQKDMSKPIENGKQIKNGKVVDVKSKIEIVSKAKKYIYQHH